MTQVNKIKPKKKSTTPVSQKMVAIINIQQHHQVAYQHQEHLFPLPYQNQYLTQRAETAIPETKKTE